MSAPTFPGTCRHCHRTATSAYGHWDGGAPGAGTYHHDARCDYHLGDPPGSIPGRCWTCGQAIGDAPAHTFTIVLRKRGSAELDVQFIGNIHDSCTDWAELPSWWNGPLQCQRCGDQIGYGQRFSETKEMWLGGRTFHTHARCPRV